jgi:hypothetical protein
MASSDPVKFFAQCFELTFSTDQATAKSGSFKRTDRERERESAHKF